MLEEERRDSLLTTTIFIPPREGLKREGELSEEEMEEEKDEDEEEKEEKGEGVGEIKDAM